ncbi:MAG: sugar ABC transporter ATP-binding protein [Oscillospiraceae bacterium]
MEKEYCVEMQSISKHFGGVQALKNVDFRLRRGEVRALLGENGAGKSTLMKILAGAVSADSGIIEIDGKPATIRSPKDSRDLGVSIIYQEFVLAPQLSVAENIFLDRLSEKSGIVNWKKINAAAKKLLMEMGFDMIDPRKQVGSMPVAYQQIVEICKSLSQDAHILILDEPTAVLTFGEIERLFGIVKKLKDCGWGIIYISHRLEEVFQICDTATILKDGEFVGEYDVNTLTKRELVNLMVGRTMSNYYPARDHNIGKTVLSVSHLAAGSSVKDVSFYVRAGEVLGISGLVGAGRTESMRAIFGIDKIDSGEILLNGKSVRFSSPDAAVKAGIGFLPEDRKNEGVVLSQSIRFNTTLSNIGSFSRFGINSYSKERKIAEELLTKLHTKYGGLEDPVSSLSGGNQQKVALAKWLAANCQVIILDEPTRGVDVGAKSEIYSIINSLAQDGAAVIMISSEMEEIINMCDRAVVMRQGIVTGELDKKELNEQGLIALAMGVA